MKIVIKKRPKMNVFSNIVQRELKKGYNVHQRSDYIVEEELGRGGFGIVYRVTNSQGRSFALKKVIFDPPARPERGTPEEIRSYNFNRQRYENDFKERLASIKEEAMLTSRLGIANVVNVIDTIEDGKETYVLSDFVDGPDLDTFIDWHIRRGELPPLELTGLIAHRVSKVLDYSHNIEKMAHRDVSSSNILVETKDGRVRMTDWEGASEKLSGAIYGKPAWMAPELIYSFKKMNTIARMNISDEEKEAKYIELANERVALDKFKTDIFSFGNLIYLLATGINPIDINTPEQKNYTECYRLFLPSADSILPIRNICGDVPKSLSKIVASSMSEHPDQRPSADEMNTYLGEGFLFNEQIFGGEGLTDSALQFYLLYMSYLDLVESGETPTGLHKEFFPNGVGPDVPLEGKAGKHLAKIARFKYRAVAEEKFPGKPLRETEYWNEDVCFGDLRRPFQDAFYDEHIKEALQKKYLHTLYNSELSKIKSNVQDPIALKKMEHDLDEKMAMLWKSDIQKYTIPDLNKWLRAVVARSNKRNYNTEFMSTMTEYFTKMMYRGK